MARKPRAAWPRLVGGPLMGVQAGTTTRCVVLDTGTEVAVVVLCVDVVQAMARMALGEALTNLVWAPLTDWHDIKVGREGGRWDHAQAGRQPQQHHGVIITAAASREVRMC